MNRIRKFRREVFRPWWYDWEWPVIGGLALVVLVLGVVGFRMYLTAAGKPVEAVDLVFRTFQLFVLQINVDPPMPWQLNVARILAPLVAGYTAIQALSRLLADQFQSFRLRFLRRHVVICGLGRKGLVLSRAFLEQGNTVVVIEPDADNDYIGQCRDLGGIVLLGDASDATMLAKARVSRATHLFALTGDDGLNAEIAIRAIPLVPKDRADVLTCVLHVFDAQLCALLRERELDHGPSDRVRLEFFNTFDLAARVLLEEHPLCDPGDDPSLATGCLVIVGMGWLGESLLAAAARQWRAGGHAPDQRLKVTLIDQNAGELVDRLKVRYPGLPKACDLEVLDMDVRSAGFQRAEFLAPLHPGGPATRVFVCMDDDSLNLSTALSLASAGHTHEPRIVVRMARDAGLAVLLKDADQCGGGFHYLRAFCLLDRTCRPEQILNGTRETLARAIHADYLMQERARGVDPAQNRSIVPWDELPGDLKEGNRQQADDIRRKLSIVGCGTSPMADWDEPLFQFTEGEKDLLAREEHDRWWESKKQQGWVHGPVKDGDAKTHPCMIPYDELPQCERQKDIDTVCLIPELLARIGFRVCRVPQPGRFKT